MIPADYEMIMKKMCFFRKYSLDFTGSYALRQGKMRQITAAFSEILLLAEGHAVGALLLGGIGLVGAHTDLVQRAVILVLAVVGAGAHGAPDGLVGMAVHKEASFAFGFGNSMCRL